jgi:hypothetical protein
MELYIFGADRKLKGVLEAFEYLRWTRKYTECGDFSLKAIANDGNLELLKQGNIVWKSDDVEAGIIEHIELAVQEKEYITVSGRFATSLLGRRIVWQTEILQGDLSAGIGQLIQNNVILPTDSSRAIANFAFNSPVLGISTNTQISYRNLLAAIEELCTSYGVGIRTAFHPATGSLTVELYRGNQTQAIFSKEYDNLIEQTYTHSRKDYANVALVGGEGEGADRIMATAGAASGEDRYELFVDAKSLRSVDFGTEYGSALIEQGAIKLSELAEVFSFDATVNGFGNLRYKEDFDLGDSIAVLSKRWGVSLQTSVEEIEESYDADGRSIGVVLGRGVLTLGQKLKGVY